MSKDCPLGLYYKDFPITVPHSSSQVDINGDCTPDLLITSYDQTKKQRHLEIWRGVRAADNSVKYCLDQDSVYLLAPELTIFSISDINRDGMLDLVFPIGVNFPKVLIAYNQIPLTFDWEEDYCAVHASSKPGKVFNELKLEYTEEEKALPLSNQINILYETEDQKFYTADSVYPVIRVGDVNADSYPDITFTLLNKDKTRKAYMLLNKLNTRGLERSKETVVLPFENSAVNKSSETSELFNLEDTEVAYTSFFDLDENGQLDLIVVLRDHAGNHSIKGYFNNFNYDSFFLKSINLIKDGAYSAFSIGSTYRLISTNLDGSRRMDVNLQAAQLSCQYLNLPYSFIGVGRSNNYVENFHVISSTNAKKSANYKIFTPIIPNSQLLISENRSEEALNWALDLIVNPTSQLFLLIIVIGIILILILAVIIYLHYKEGKEDQENENAVFNMWYN